MWSDLQASAAHCEVCGILVRGCRGCFNQREKDESQIQHCHISFLYDKYENYDNSEDEDEEQEGQPEDVDKDIVFHFKDGSWFTVQIFSDSEGEKLEEEQTEETGLTVVSADKFPVLDAWESLPAYNSTSPRTESDEALAVAREWIETCLSSAHKSCRSPSSPPLPTRIVDVQDIDVVKVAELGEGSTGSYLCLSHCWGSEQPTRTMRENLAVHRTRGISVQALPKTFRHAALLTRRLGFRYLWIDSLCIVQDDPADWKAESAKMAQIYQNAVVTLAATTACGSIDGLYVDTPTYSVTGSSTVSGKPYTLFFREKIDHHIENANEIPGGTSNPGMGSRSTNERHPLLTRAWVFQERLLSTRMLHFGPYELFFECNTDMQCECGGIGFMGSSEQMPTSMTRLLYTDAMANHTMRKKLRIAPSMAEGGVRSAGHWMARLWRTMVSSYMGLDITKPHDRLPALGGLAQNMATKRSAKDAATGHYPYLAGLWRDALPDDLLWIVYGGKSLKPRPRMSDSNSLSAPTWSWASVCGSTMYYDEILFWQPDIWLNEGAMAERGRQPRHLAQIEGCTVVSDGGAEFGLVTSGTLTISGAVAEGHLECQTEDVSKPKCLRLLFENSSTEIEHQFFPDYKLDEPGPDQVLPGAKVVCLRMGVRPEGVVDYLASLVLRSKPGTGYYERIGTFLIKAVPPLEDMECGIFKETEVRKLTIQ